MIYKNKHDVSIFNQQWHSIDDSIEYFFFKNCESISYDLLLKNFWWCLCSTTSWFCLFQFFILCAFVQWKILKWFSSIFSIEFSFVQQIAIHDVSSNMIIFCWLLNQKFCSSCLIKQLNIMFSQYHTCFCQIYVKSLCCFFDIFWNDIFD